MSDYNIYDSEFLASHPYEPADVSGDLERAYTNRFVTVDFIPSVFGTFSTVGAGNDGGARRGAVVLVYHTGDVLMVRQPRPAIGRLTWELPRGGAHYAETLEDAALREVFEETGVFAEPEQLISLGKIYPDTGILNTDIEVFFLNASFGNKSPLTLGEDENIVEAVWVPSGTLVDACMDGTVEDGFTIMAVMRAFTRNLLQ